MMERGSLVQPVYGGELWFICSLDPFALFNVFFSGIVKIDVCLFILPLNRMFRVFGHTKVWVLDGGLPRWRASGYDVESSASGDAILKASAASEAIEKIYQGQTVSRPFG